MAQNEQIENSKGPKMSVCAKSLCAEVKSEHKGTHEMHLLRKKGGQGIGVLYMAHRAPV
jgi:hypothetical protein